MKRKFSVVKSLLKSQELFLIILFTFLFNLTPCFADRGLFWWNTKAMLTQSAQKAVIFHNLKEEILILETELQTNTNTEVLEFIPFPCQPEVELARGDPFREINNLLLKKKLFFRKHYYKGKVETENVEILSSKKIGPHDVTIIKINQLDDFTNWIIEFLTKKGIKNITIDRLKNISEIAKYYISRGIKYFVFDYVKLEKATQRIEPLIYRFETNRLYYPLKTSNTIGGSGSVEIVMVTPIFFEGNKREMKTLSIPFSKNRPIEISDYAEVTISELKPVYEKINDFFPINNKIYIQMLRYKGKYDFIDDLNVNLNEIISNSLELKKDLIDATLLSIEKSWQRISEDSCIFLDEEIIRHFELWRSKFKSMKPEDYKFSYESPISVQEDEVPWIKGFGPIYPPISQKIKIDKPFKIGSELKLDNKHNYKVIKMSKNLENANFTKKEVTVYLVYVEYNPITLSNKCIYRVNPKMIDSRTYYVYVDEN